MLSPLERTLKDSLVSIMVRLAIKRSDIFLGSSDYKTELMKESVMHLNSLSDQTAPNGCKCFFELVACKQKSNMMLKRQKSFSTLKDHFQFHLKFNNDETSSRRHRWHLKHTKKVIPEEKMRERLSKSKP